MSLTSARVGYGFSIIDSSICVAVITNFPCFRARSMMDFWMNGTFSSAISTPRSPRATMTPSLSSRICFEIRPTFRLLDLRDDLHVRVRFFQVQPQPQHIVALAHKRQRDEVDPRFQTEAQVRDVFLAQRRRTDFDARQIDPLAIGNRPAADHFANGIGI